MGKDMPFKKPEGGVPQEWEVAIPVFIQCDRYGKIADDRVSYRDQGVSRAL